MLECLRYQNPSLTVQLPILIMVWICYRIRLYIRKSSKMISIDTIQMYRNSAFGFRARLLVENGIYMSNAQYMMRKAAYFDEETGFFTLTKINRSWKESIMNLNVAEYIVKFKEQVFYTLSQSVTWLLIYSLMKHSFAGVLPMEIPHGYKTILQIGIKLKNLSSNYVSPLSWYLVVVYLIEYIDGLSHILCSNGTIFADFFINNPRNPRLSVGVSNSYRFGSSEYFSREIATLEKFTHYFQPHISEFQALGVLNKLKVK